MSQFDAILVEVSKLDLKAGDVIVINVNARISDETARRIKEAVGVTFPDNECLVLSDELELAIVSAH